ncbi:MAG: hypothetical protein AAFR11_15585 [Pseudomonadota bacterium]
MTTTSIIAAIAAAAAAIAPAFAQDHAQTPNAADWAEPQPPMTPQMMRSQIIAREKARVIAVGASATPEAALFNFEPNSEEIAVAIASHVQQHVAPLLRDGQVIVLTSAVITPGGDVSLVAVER